MSRHDPDRGPDTHLRFMEWLVAGGAGDPSRDAAVHAAHCIDCRRAMAAFDVLTAVDLERAGMPPWVEERRFGGIAGVLLARAGTVGRMAAAAGTLLLVVAGGSLAVGGLLGRPTGPSPTQDQAVLGGAGQPSASPAELTGIPEATPSATRSPTPSLSPTATSTPTATPHPTAQLTPLPAAPRPTTPRPTPTPRPSATPTQQPTPPPSATPSPERTPLPSAEPTPSPTPTESGEPS